MLFHRTALALAGTTAFFGTALPATAAECGCWRSVRPSTESADAMLGAVTAPAEDAAWAVGSRGGAPLVLRWNGVRWREIRSPLPAGTLLEGVAAASPHEGWLVGYGPDGTPRTAHLRKKKWRSVQLPISGPSFPRDVDVRRSGEAWIVGSSSGANATQATTWHWNGHKWRTVPIPDGSGVNSELVAVSSQGPNDAWAVGTRGAYPPRQLLLHWDGQGWTPSKAPELPGESTLADVVTTRSGAWAVGSTRAKEADLPLAEHWDGKSWQVVPIPGAHGRFYSVASDGKGGIWAAGEDDTRHLLLAHWNGVRWDISRAPVPDPSGDGDARGPAAAWGLADTPGTPYLWAVGSYGRKGADPLRHALTWTNSPRPR